MAYMIYTCDKPQHKQVRDEFREAHYAYLMAHKHLLIASGGLQDDSAQSILGGLIVLDVDTLDEVQAFVESDPFTRAGLFERVEVVRWKMAFFDGERVAG